MYRSHDSRFGRGVGMHRENLLNGSCNWSGARRRSPLGLATIPLDSSCVGPRQEVSRRHCSRWRSEKTRGKKETRGDWNEGIKGRNKTVTRRGARENRDAWLANVGGGDVKSKNDEKDEKVDEEEEEEEVVV